MNNKIIKVMIFGDRTKDDYSRREVKDILSILDELNIVLDEYFLSKEKTFSTEEEKQKFLKYKKTIIEKHKQCIRKEIAILLLEEKEKKPNTQLKDMIEEILDFVDNTINSVVYGIVNIGTCDINEYRNNCDFVLFDRLLDLSTNGTYELNKMKKVQLPNGELAKRDVLKKELQSVEFIMEDNSKKYNNESEVHL